MAPALLKKMFERSSQRTDYERLLLASPSARSSETLVSKGLDTGTSKKSANPRSAENKDSNKNDTKTCSVQICPHETLSFERMKRIVHLPHFKYNRDKIGAFTKAPSHHHVLSSEGTYRCEPYPKDFRSLNAKGHYKYQRGFDGSHDGLILCVDWSMNLDEHKDFTSSRSQVQRFLDALDIHLCEHITMSDMKITAELFEFCHPNRVEGDPVEAYEEEHRARRANQCRKCHTTFNTYQEGEESHVLVRRYLGQGTSIYEGPWLAQCGEGKHKLRSLGVAVLQSLRQAAT